MTWDTVAPYNRGFREFAAAFEAFGFDEVHRGAVPFLPAAPGLMLDVGAGSGRDADWFAARGWDVIAAEPANGLRLQAASLHPTARIRWIDDRLPALSAVHRLGLTFDLIWLSGVWMHVHPDERSRAMRKLTTLLKPGGRMVLTLRHGPAPDDRPMWPVSAQEVERLGIDLGLALRVATERADDLQGRADVRWQTVILDLPDDGKGALPLLRGVILKQEKSATYKLALLRCIARIAEDSPNVARDAGDHVEIPLGLIALNWLRMFKPLLERGLPQTPDERMGFVKAAFHGLGTLAPYELRLGMQFSGDIAAAVRGALGDAARVIADMPAKHLTFADDTPVFATEYGRRPTRGEHVLLSAAFLWEFGTTLVPLTVWHALIRMSAWIEPMLLAEWVRLTKSYAKARVVTADEVIAALRWQDPERDTLAVRRLAVERLRKGEQLRCVWSGRPLSAGTLDIDHCLPWSAWACNDFWNLLPALPRINRTKSGKLISSATLAEARPLIVDWWERTYVAGAPGVRARFQEEVRNSLPVGRTEELDMDELFLALDMRRLRLQQDTQAMTWDGMVPRAQGGAAGH